MITLTHVNEISNNLEDERTQKVEEKLECGD